MKNSFLLAIFVHNLIFTLLLVSKEIGPILYWIVGWIIIYKIYYKKPTQEPSKNLVGVKEKM